MKLHILIVTLKVMKTINSKVNCYYFGDNSFLKT